MMRDPSTGSGQSANGLQYFLTDHLGSTVATTDSNGTLTSQQRYLPFGGTRTNVTAPNSLGTDFGYTGQRQLDAGMGGLMDYKARFYSPMLGRFVQPDTIIPGGPQGLNRYAYVRNNPVNFNDPTGHRPCGDGERWDCDGRLNPTPPLPSGGGGDDEEDEEDDPIDSLGSSNESDDLLDVYLTGWENFGQAWSIWTNPNASYGQKWFAGAYMSYWGGAHGMFVVGVVILSWEAIAGLAIGASADGDPTNEIRTFYRGDSSGLNTMVSKAGQISMDYARRLLANGNWTRMMTDHAKNSSSPLSPFVSVTTDPRVAQIWAELGGGQVYKIVTSRAIQNLNGFPAESEWLVPLVIRAGEIIK